MSLLRPSWDSATLLIRPAVPADLGGVVEVMRSIMPLNPQWDYRFQYRHEFPEDHTRYTELMLQLLIDPSYDDWRVMVAEAPSLKNPDVTKIVAFAVWDISYKNKRTHGSEYKSRSPFLDVAIAAGSTRRDVNPKRQAAFAEAIGKARQAYFDDIDGQDQIYLQILGTHPDYMRRGFGASLVHWGISVAKQDKLVVPLTASPMGKLLYSRLGFETLGQIVIQVREEPEMVFLVIMVLDAKKEEQRKHDLQTLAVASQNTT